jgi:predicted ATP-grasp superfamily ATP-dependent carboligase
MLHSPEFDAVAKWSTENKSELLICAGGPDSGHKGEGKYPIAWSFASVTHITDLNRDTLSRKKASYFVTLIK